MRPLGEGGTEPPTAGSGRTPPSRTPKADPREHRGRPENVSDKNHTRTNTHRGQGAPVSEGAPGHGAIGGLRSAQAAVREHGGNAWADAMAPLAERVRELAQLQELQDLHSCLYAQTPPGQEALRAIEEARREVARDFGIPAPRGGQYWGQLLAHLAGNAADPDVEPAEWLTSGAPLGAHVEFGASGVFPPAPNDGAAPLPLEDLPGQDAQGNYLSADEHAEAVASEVEREVAAGFVTRYSSRQEAEEAAGGPLTQSRLACIAKKGSGKLRVIMDCRRSGVNGAAVVPERITLPTLQDVVESTTSALREGEVGLAVLDFADAFKHVPLRPEERRVAAFEFGGSWYVYNSLPMGASGSPLAWCRVVALLMRATAGIFPDGCVDIHTYVDDPIIVMRGHEHGRQEAARQLLCFWLLMGAPLSWAKAQWGSSAQWIGAHVAVGDGEVTVALPPETTRKWALDVDKARRAGRAPVEEVRKMAGRGSWAGGIIPELRPFVRCLWAAVAAAEGAWVPTRRMDHALRWLAAVYAAVGPQGGMRRTYTAVEAAGRAPLEVTTDASPHGIGAVASYRGRPLAYLTGPITQQDAERFGTCVGRHNDQALWEALAIVVAVRTFGPIAEAGAAGGARPILVHSDSTAALGALGKLSSPDQRVNAVARELAYSSAARQWRIDFAHLAGVDNGLADDLSRGRVPPELLGARRLELESRDTSFWKTMGPLP